MGPKATTRLRREKSVTPPRTTHGASGGHHAEVALPALKVVVKPGDRGSFLPRPLPRHRARWPWGLGGGTFLGAMLSPLSGEPRR